MLGCYKPTGYNLKLKFSYPNIKNVNMYFIVIVKRSTINNLAKGLTICKHVCHSWLSSICWIIYINNKQKEKLTYNKVTNFTCLCKWHSSIVKELHREQQMEFKSSSSHFFFILEFWFQKDNIRRKTVIKFQKTKNENTK